MTLTCQTLSRIADASENWQAACGVDVTDWDTANEFILATYCLSDLKNDDGTFKLQWRRAGGSFADVTATTEVCWGTGTTLIDNASFIFADSAGCAVVGVWDSGEENEGDNSCVSTNIANGDYGEHHWALGFGSGVQDNQEYEFQLVCTTYSNDAICAATITTAAGAATYSVTKTIDGHVYDEYTVTKTIDGMVWDTYSITKTIDGRVYEQNSITKNLDGHVYDSYSITKTVDGNIWDTLSITKTLDGMAYDTYSVTKTVDGEVYDANTYDITKTVDGHIYDSYTITKNIDGIIWDTYSITKTIDGVVTDRLSITKNLDGHVYDSYSITKDIDGRVYDTYSISKTVDGSVYEQNSVTKYVDGHVYGSYSVTKTVDGVVYTDAGDAPIIPTIRKLVAYQPSKELTLTQSQKVMGLYISAKKLIISQTLRLLWIT